MMIRMPYQPSLLRLLHGVSAAVAGVASVTGFLIYNHYDGRYGRMPLGGSEEIIDLHGDLGGLLPWVVIPFALYSLTLGIRRLFRPADLGRMVGSLPAWQRLTNTAALLGLAAAVLSGLPMDDDWHSGPGWSLHAKTGWQNAPGAGLGWWVGWVQKGDQITPFALNIAMAGAADAPKREQLGRSSLQALGILPTPSRGPVLAP